VAEISYTSLKKNLAGVLDRVTQDQETVIVKRRGAEDVALLPARELSGVMETAYLLSSPANARRLLRALSRVHKRERTGS
jgi:antitoxin YefM